MFRVASGMVTFTDDFTLHLNGEPVADTPRNRNRADLDFMGSIMPPPDAVDGTYEGPDGNNIKVPPLLAEDRPVGALNIYSRNAATFTPQDQELAAVFATEASVILTSAGVDVSDDQRASRLAEALRARLTGRGYLSLLDAAGESRPVE